MTRSLQAGMPGPSAPTRTRPPRGPPPRGRNQLLTTHVGVAGGGRGTDRVLLTRRSPAWPAATPELIRAGYLVVGLLAEAVLVPLALAALATGSCSGLGPHGVLTRHSWVLTKLALTIGTATAAVFVLQPALNRAAAQALQVPLAELSTAGIGRLGVAVTLAPAGRCWYRWPPWRWRSSNPGD